MRTTPAARSSHAVSATTTCAPLTGLRTRADPDATTVSSEQRPRRLRKIVVRVLPWASLAIGVVGAIFMDRGPGHGRIVAGAAIGCWLTLLVVLWLRAKAEASGRILWRGAHFTTLLVTQSAIHLSLFFAVPFYWKAWGGTVEQAVFIGVLTLAALASLWDPLTEWLLHHPTWAPVMPALATFGALNAVLPGIGLSNSHSLWAAVGCTAIAMPLGVVLRPDRPDADAAARARDRRRLVIASIVVALVGPIGLWLGAARIVPAAPLALVDAAIGTRQRGRWVDEPIERLDRRPGMLVCATAIWAPQGVHERLYHVWRQNGVERDRIELEIEGGREKGFRTWSRKRNFGDDPGGTWTCSVETGLGQLLGTRAIVIESP